MTIPKHAETLAWFLYTGIADREEALRQTAEALRTDAPIPDGMHRPQFAAFVADLPGEWQESAEDAAGRMATDAEATDERVGEEE